MDTPAFWLLTVRIASVGFGEAHRTETTDLLKDARRVPGKSTGIGNRSQPRPQTFALPMVAGSKSLKLALIPQAVLTGCQAGGSQSRHGATGTSPANTFAAHTNKAVNARSPNLWLAQIL